ncbi:Ankyrin repeat domain-containing protein 1 [Hondaea fermentalgiana]|uniref:histone deacetylase n=1 Tax=Hondaea fermentalgiana TaxID=2315210 RepID=A0A2R5FZL9_9STRA|nr:Ankyrin repeat domain-containing protein 1 [Hondaea fermentalgiana]|eukprot:GBG24202.1 Ankyrin repeat domain-containing protein 1 [Hondaea fermentalgiana]
MGSRAESEEDLQGVVTSSRAQDEQVGRVQHAIETSLVAEDGADAKAGAQSQVDAPTLATRDPSQVAEVEMSDEHGTYASDEHDAVVRPSAVSGHGRGRSATGSFSDNNIYGDSNIQSLNGDRNDVRSSSGVVAGRNSDKHSTYAKRHDKYDASVRLSAISDSGPTTSKLRIVNPERLSGSESDENDFGSQQRNGSFPVPMYSPRMGDLNGLGSPRPVGLGSPRLTKVGSGSVSLIFTAPPTAGTSTAAKREAAAAKRAAKAQKPAPPASSQMQQRTALHEAILAGDEEAFDRLLVDLAIDEIDACEPKTGYSALMSASACEDGADAARLVAKLIERGAEIRTLDAEGFSAVHWAAAMGNCAAMEALLDAGADLDGQSESGDTALHRAARFGRDACIKSLVRDYGADVNVRNENDETALDAAGYLSPNKQIASRVRAAARKALFEADTRMKTLVVMHEECLGHRTAQAHQEAPERISAIHGKLKAGIDPECLQFCSAFEPATKALLRYAHNDKYIDLVFDLHQKVASLGRPVPFTPRVQVMNGLEENQLKDERGCDTFFSEGSLPAARRAVGGVCCAVDHVVSGTNRNAFCLVRPPGHHAGVNGLLDNAVSCGFCIFNNVAIGAMHALTKYKSFIRRIAIVDFDVHHGNGTEEIVRTKFKRPEDILFFSIHLFDKAEDKAVGSGEFYPGSGGKDDPQCNVINSPIMPLWRVPTNRTRSKKRRLTDDDGPAAPQSRGAESKNGVDMSAPPSTSDGTNGSHFSSPPLPTGPNYGRQAFRDHVNSRLVPALYRFDPDLIFISAGFDAGKNDVGCSRTENGKYWSGIDLGPDDYAFVTAEIQQVARACCQGRVVSLLEGGYGQWAREKTGAAGEPKKLVLNRDQLGENALAHVRALVDK